MSCLKTHETEDLEAQLVETKYFKKKLKRVGSKRRVKIKMVQKSEWQKGKQ